MVVLWMIVRQQLTHKKLEMGRGRGILNLYKKDRITRSKTESQHNQPASELCAHNFLPVMRNVNQKEKAN